MTATKCPVEAMARDFAVSIATIDELDEAMLRLEGEARAQASAQCDAAWDRLLCGLYEQGMNATPASQAGVALQLALLIDELVQLESLEWEPAELAARFVRARKVLRSALKHIDASAAQASGVAHFFAGERPSPVASTNAIAH